MGRRSRNNRIRRRVRKRSISMDRLPESIVLGILSRLPNNSMAMRRCVCKKWLHIFSDPYFVHINSLTPNIQFLVQDHACQNSLYLAELLQESITCDHTNLMSCVDPDSTLDLKLRKVMISNPGRRIDISVTLDAKGLILIVDSDNNVYHVYNPITCQHYVVPRTNWCSWFVEWNSFLVLCRRTNQVKLLRFLLDKESHYDVIHGYIYTVNGAPNSSWRRGEGLGYVNIGSQWPHPINGVFHWLNKDSPTIYAFDVEEEVLGEVPSSLHMQQDEEDEDNNIMEWEDMPHHKATELGSLEGFLCLFREDAMSGNTEVWVMNEYGKQESWTKKFVLQNDIPLSGRIRHIRCLENWEILMIMCKDYRMICYNPISESFRYLEFKTDGPKYTIFPYYWSLEKVLIPSEDECVKHERISLMAID